MYEILTTQAKFILSIDCLLKIFVISTTKLLHFYEKHNTKKLQTVTIKNKIGCFEAQKSLFCTSKQALFFDVDNIS